MELATSQRPLTRYTSKANVVMDGSCLVHTFTSNPDPTRAAAEYADYLNRSTLIDPTPYEGSTVIAPPDWHHHQSNPYRNDRKQSQ